MNRDHVPVLIVGAGVAGLSLSVLLLQQGVPSLLVERRAGISIYPRARNLNYRSLEVMRGLGLVAEVHAAGTSLSHLIFKESLASSKQEKIVDPTPWMEHLETTSPEPLGWYCPQSRLEPILLATARQRGGDVRYSTELISFTQDEQGVIATLEDRTTGRTYIMNADYLVAADGAHSHIREKLGIHSQGLGVLPEHIIFVYFHSPWKELIAGHDAGGFMSQNADVQGLFVVASDDMGMFIYTGRLSQGESLESFTREQWKDMIEKAIGKPDIPVEVVDIARWQPAESVADQFQVGRVFLLGDAAHTMPAYKGLGANTGIQSAQNLGWKLAAVIHGQATQALLTTYQAERHPVGRFAARQSLTGPGAAWLEESSIISERLPKEEDLPFFYPIVGYRYRSQAVLSEDAAPSSPDEITLLDREELTGQPGTRVPHLWLERQGQRISTLDLLDGRFVLLTGSDGAAWCEAAAGVKTSLGIELAAYRVGPEADLFDLDHDWQTRMGVSPTGAILLRPDSFVAWRTATLAPAPEQTLEQVLAHILGRSTAPVSP